ncbi:hypothetical protein AALP_AAs73359U000100 [Arabis alpina]|uniref:Uncharacterized protein n=1 Tax=Arabis alpina TaxID=50452 RepID=A0A087FWB9_ARAAL|nr:hypothetical protein AALP_AAs73359U000100 [Arabis alpina]
MDGFFLFRADMRRDLGRLTGPAPKVPSGRQFGSRSAFEGAIGRRTSRCDVSRKTTGSGKPPTPTTATTPSAPTAVPAPAEPTTALASATPITAPAFARPTIVPASAKPPTVPASARPTTVPPSEPRDTSSAEKTTTTAKGSRLPSVIRTKVVAALPALLAPLPSDYDAKRAAKGKGHEGEDRKRSSYRDDGIDVDRVSKKARARSASPPRRVSRSVFQDRASASSLFSTLVFHDDVVAPISTQSSGDMMRQGLKFLALVNKVGHELEADVEDLKKKVEAETHRTENARTAAEAEAQKSTAALLAEAEKSAIALGAAEEREQYLADVVTKRDGELTKVVERLRQADEQIRSLKRKFARAKDCCWACSTVMSPPSSRTKLAFLTADVAEHAGDEECLEQLMKSLHGLLHVLDPKVKASAVVAHNRTLETYAASVGVVDPSGSLLGGTGSHKAAVVSVDGKFSLTGGVGAEVTKSRIEDVAEGAGTVGGPEEMKMDEDSQGPRIDALTEDPRLDDVFGETEVERAPVAQVAPPGVDEETVP